MLRLILLLIVLIIIFFIIYQNQRKVENFKIEKSFYNQSYYPNMQLPAQVIGCGARNTPCMGGTQIPIANPMPPIDISEKNIAPTTVKLNLPPNRNKIIQVGVLYKIFGNFNTYIPLYYDQENDLYFGILKNQKILISKENLGVNDEIIINNQKYRVTIYENDVPEFSYYH